MFTSQPDLPTYHPLPAYTAEPRRGHEHRLLVHDPPNVPLSVPSPPRQWREQFVKHSKSGGVTLKVSNQRSNAPLPVHHGGTTSPIQGSVDLAKTENVTSVDLKECVVPICPFPSRPISSVGMGLSITMKNHRIYISLFSISSLRAGYSYTRLLPEEHPPQSCVTNGQRYGHGKTRRWITPCVRAAISRYHSVYTSRQRFRTSTGHT